MLITHRLNAASLTRPLLLKLHCCAREASARLLRSLRRRRVEARQRCHDPALAAAHEPLPSERARARSSSASPVLRTATRQLSTWGDVGELTTAAPPASRRSWKRPHRLSFSCVGLGDGPTRGRALPTGFRGVISADDEALERNAIVEVEGRRASGLANSIASSGA